MTKEIQGYLTTMNEMREQVKSLLEGLPEEALDWRPIEGEGEWATNSLGVMVSHLAGSATYLIKEGLLQIEWVKMRLKTSNSPLFIRFL